MRASGEKVGREEGWVEGDVGFEYAVGGSVDGERTVSR